jgi:ribosome maturation factor RimP
MKKNIAATVAELILPTVTGLDCTLWDVEYVKEGADWHLRVTIDRPEGVTINDCERVHRAIDPLLDEADPIEGFYYLEVSSPGIERELRTDTHLEASLGEACEIRLFAARDGARVYRGRLTGYDREGVTLTLADGSEAQFARDGIAKISTVYED